MRHERRPGQPIKLTLKSGAKPFTDPLPPIKAHASPALRLVLFVAMLVAVLIYVTLFWWMFL